MKTQHLFLRLLFLSTLFIVFLSGFSFHEEKKSTVFIAYPRIKNDATYYVFFNANKIANIHYGERLEYNFSSEGTLKIVILPQEVYVEPKTLSHNTRTISIQDKKDFYFEINGKGELEYLVDTTKGKSIYTSKDFSQNPHIYTENNQQPILH